MLYISVAIAMISIHFLLYLLPYLRIPSHSPYMATFCSEVPLFILHLCRIERENGKNMWDPTVELIINIKHFIINTFQNVNMLGKL